MKVLVTGGAGYIGSVLIGLLLQKGYQVRCLDRFFFGRDTVSAFSENGSLELVQGDVRWISPEVMEGVEAVIDMAALSNDPSGELNPEKTMEINFRGRVRMAKVAKEYGVKRYVLASSCSIYGFQEGLLDETSMPNPLTTYAKANLTAEQAVLPMQDGDFIPVVLRQATVYGLSPRMRFDIAINGMILGFYKNGKIPILRDGNQWRPFVHVRDTSKAFIMALEADAEQVAGQIFNVGSNSQNYQIYPLAELVAESVELPFNYEWYGSPDNRSYQVDFGKIKQVLGYRPDYTPREGAKEIYLALKEGKLSDGMKTITVQWYKHLLEMQEFIREVEIDGVLL